MTNLKMTKQKNLIIDHEKYLDLINYKYMVYTSEEEFLVKIKELIESKRQ